MERCNPTPDNAKKILCYNIISGKKCMYGNKCLYAHHVNEQNVDAVRVKIYNMLKSEDDLSELNLVDDNKLYDSLVIMTKICMACAKGTCIGYYNCRSGCISKEYKVCYDDLVYGNCKFTKCNYIHLTARGLVPYLKQKNKGKNYYGRGNKRVTENKAVENTIDKNLIEYLLMAKNIDNESTDSHDEENVEDIINYLNNDNSSSDESIFLV